MLPATLQFFVAMIASAMAERLTRKVAYMHEEVRYVTDPQSRIIDAGSHGRNFWSPVAGESCRVFATTTAPSASQSVLPSFVAP